jgi:phosphoenolpyruvate carboxykinase (ATP)
MCYNVTSPQQSLHSANTTLSTEQLVERSLYRKESVRATNGALVVNTGTRTGRSPKDRFIVDDVITHNNVAWGQWNQPIDTATFKALWKKATAYLADKETFSADLAVGADLQYQIPVHVTTELAWHLLFCQHLFLNDASAATQPAWRLLNAANFKTDPKRDGVHSDATVIINFSERKLLICGIHYAGEMKKGMFSVLNYLLPQKNVLPMHCSANVGNQGDVALFFGLSGTGKTTLSADAKRLLIGDDEHGWSEHGIFNFEGGCYAKCIGLAKTNEPIIWQAIRDGAIMENVVLDENGTPDYDDDTYTQNTRAAYPLSYIEKRVIKSTGSQPQAIIFLTCDLYGVLPPVAKLTREQAAYYFLSGYTALVGSTEVGHNKTIQPAFSTCFGSPFFPLPANIYANLLLKKIDATDCPVYLVNTGWSGGAHQQGGQRFSIATTRHIIDAIVDGSIKHSDYQNLPQFNFAMPSRLDGVQSELLDPRRTWHNLDDYQRYATILINAFQENFKQYQVDADITAAGPTL